MMNILAISLVLTTLVTAGLFNEKKDQDHVIVEEGGHRVVVVEYVNDDGTKVSISPQDHAASGYVSDVKDKLREKAEEASSVLPNIGQGISSPSVDDHNRPSARDVVCDAFGKCKHKIATAFGKTKDTVEEDAKEAFVKTKEAASEKVDQVKQGDAENVKDEVDDVKETAAKVKGKAKDVIETTKGKMKEEVYDMAKKVEEKAEQGKDFVKEGAERVKEEGKKELKEILQLGREFFSGVFAYMLRPVMRLAHLLGFAVAYGMCIWVTFISSFVLARALPRHQFAVVQSKIYPVYFKAMAYSVGAAFLGHLLSQKHRRTAFYANSSEAIQGFNLLASVAMLLVNLLYFEPRATKVMFERLKLEKEEGRGVDILNNVEPSSRGVDTVVVAPADAKTTAQPTAPAAVNVDKSEQVVRLSQKLKKLNSYSSFLNVLTLMALSHHLVHITQLVDT